MGQRLVLLRVDTDVCSSEYLLAALQSQYVKQQIEQVSKSGSIVSNFNISDLKELIIPVLIAGNGDFNVKHYSGEFNAYQRTYVLIPENQVYYGAMYISAKNQIQAFKNGSNGSIVKFITKGDVENIPFILPNDDSIFQQINKLIEKIELCERENEELTKLRDWLLPMLMNGQARVE